MVKRNIYHLPNPPKNFRIIWAELFSDSSLSPEEKGVMIGLYCLCINNEFRIDLSDKLIYSHLDMAKNTYKKYRDLLIEKKVIWSSYDVPMKLVWAEHMETQVLLYPHLGYNTWIDKVTSHAPDDDEIAGQKGRYSQKQNGQHIKLRVFFDRSPGLLHQALIHHKHPGQEYRIQHA